MKESEEFIVSVVWINPIPVIEVKVRFCSAEAAHEYQSEMFKLDSNPSAIIRKAITESQIKEAILKAVAGYPGIKGTELICADGVVRGVGVDVVALLNLMVFNRELVEVEYVLPDSNYRIRSLYFPKDTQILMPEASRGE